MMINVNDCLYGFVFSRIRELPDISATLYEAKHKKSGAELAFIKRDDKNKTFAISFTTTPTDDTGVFHILEHSVLCGSDKYPVKEPFVELLKSSLNTFLNAMTYNDKTVYPVCSKNDKDFLNLISVYMDAVLHPAMLTNEKIFRQEGWHYEPDDNGDLTYNGVVYNEMKGAYSSVDDLANEKLMQMLYPDTCYGKDSGGNPDAIPSLTYEDFVNAHQKYYHPSNSKIILDGDVKLDEVLSLLDGFLSEYDACDMNISVADQPPTPPSEASAEYEIAENEDEAGKARLILGYRTTSYDELEKNIAISLIRDYLAGSNEAPLKKALLDSGLCEDVSMYELDGIRRNAAVIDIRNIDGEKKDEIIYLIDKTIEAELSAGLKRNRLTASLNTLEYRLREADYGSYPKGLMFALSTLDTWLYGGDPAACFDYTATLKKMREHMEGDYYEGILREMLVDNPTRQVLLMLPSKTLAERRLAEEKTELAAIKSKMTPSELSSIERLADELKAWQSSENSEEALATLPRLTLDDISAEPERIPTEIKNIDGVTLLYHPIATSGIIYSTLVFDASDLSPRELYTLSFAALAMLNVRTEKSDVLTLQERIKTSLGLLSPACAQYRRKDGTPIPAFIIKAHALAQNKKELCELVREVLYTSDFSDKATLKKLLAQAKIASEESFVSAGHLAAMSRADAHVSASGAIEEYIGGYEAYKLTKAYEKDFDKEADSLIAEINRITEKLFVKSRLTVNVSCPEDEDFLRELVGTVKDGGEAPASCNISPLPPANEALVIPSRVAYAAISNHLSRLDESFKGASQVVRSILNYEHLWNSIRVQGGAYGAGILMRKTGKVSFYSYRDPNPKRTFGVYRECATFLREYVKANEDLTSIIIGSIGNYTPVLTPRTSTDLALAEYFSESSYEKEKRILEEIIGTTSDDILKIADIIDKVTSSGVLCLVGSRQHADACSDMIDAVLEI